MRHLAENLPALGLGLLVGLVSMGAVFGASSRLLVALGASYRVEIIVSAWAALTASVAAGLATYIACL